MAELDEGCEFRAMTGADVPAALAIIEEHDEDDYEWAKSTYSNSLEGQFVLTKDGRMLGVTGAKEIPATDRAYSISWTYLQTQFIGHGYGRMLLDSIIDYIRSRGGRKVFVNTSDYVDPEDGDIYRDAREAYRAAGFIEEMRQNDYYARSESQISLGLRLEPCNEETTPPETREIRLTDIDEIDECDGAYYLAWELDAEGSDVAGFELIRDQVREWGGRCIYMAFPSDVEKASNFMQRARFRKTGVLSDYFEDGIDEVHYRYDL